MNTTITRIPALALTFLAFSTCAAERIGTVTDTPVSPQRFADGVTLKEHLGRSWPAELVHFDYSFAPGKWRASNAAMVDAAGRRTPAQLRIGRRHPDGSVAEAEVWFITSLDAGAVRQFKLQPAEGETSDLHTTLDGTTLEVRNGLVGTRFHLGEKQFSTPVTASEVPPFLMEVRLRSGAWTGRGWLETPKKCRSYKVELIESGPVFARVAFEYHFDGFRGEGGDIYRGTAQITLGQEVVYLTEEFSLGDPKVYREPQFPSEAEGLLWDWWKWRPHEAEDNFCFSFTAGGAFQPTHARCIEHNVTTPTKGQSMGLDRGENEYPLPFDTNRLEFTLNALSRLQPDQAVLYTHFRKEQADSDIISILPCRPGQWRNPDMIPHDPAQIKQHTDTSDLRVYSTAQRDVLVRAPLHLGRREWAIAVLKNPGVVTEARDFTPVCRLSAKHGGFALDKVKDWILEWPDTHRYASTPPDRDSKAGKEHRDVANLLGRFVREALDFPRGGERTGINSFPNNCATFIGRARALLESGQLTAEQGRLLRAQAAFLTYLLWDDDYFPPRRNGYGGGSANMPVSVARGRMDSAANLPDHPMARQWLATSAKVMGYVINANFGEDGSPQSNPHYMGLLTDAAVSTARLLKERGAIQDEKTAFPHFHKAARFLVDMVTPVDIRLGQRLVPPVGDGYWEKHQQALTVAPVFKDSDPALAANLLWAAQKGGLKEAGVPGVTAKAPELKSVVYPGWGAFLRHGFESEAESYVGIRFGDFTLDHTHNDAGSINWYARGVPLALDFATMYSPHTPGAWLHSTLTYDHREHETPEKCPGPDHADRVSTQFTEVHGKITAFAPQPAADYVRGEANRRWFERKPYYWREEGSPSPWSQFSEWDKVELKHPFRWVRQFAFVKEDHPDGPGYLVIADDLTGNEELTPTFNFWCLASEVKEAAPRRLHFTGQHGLDCQMFVLAPKQGRIQLGGWGHKQGFLVGERGLEENQKLARVYGPRRGKGFLAVLYPCESGEPEPKVEALAGGKLVKLTLPDQTHWILLSKEPVNVRDGQLKLTGTAAVVKRWNDGRVLATMLAAGEAECGDVKLKTSVPTMKESRRP